LCDHTPRCDLKKFGLERIEAVVDIDFKRRLSMFWWCCGVEEGRREGGRRDMGSPALYFV
jgi:hypothetical protein